MRLDQLLALPFWAITFYLVRPSVLRQAEWRKPAGFLARLFTSNAALSLTLQIDPVARRFDQAIGIRNLSWLLAYILGVTTTYCGFSAWTYLHENHLPRRAAALAMGTIILLILAFLPLAANPEIPHSASFNTPAESVAEFDSFSEHDQNLLHPYQLLNVRCQELHEKDAEDEFCNTLRYTMQIDVANLTPEAHEALVECLKIAARRGRLLREAREREQAAACADSLQNNVADEIDRQSSPEDPSQQVNDDQQNRCDSSLGDTVIDLALTGTEASST